MTDTADLRHSPAEVIGQLLIDLGLGSDPVLFQAWPVFNTGEPSAPDDCITVYDIDGSFDARIMDDGVIEEHPGWQIRVRATDHKTGWQKLDLIRTTISENVYAEFTTLDGILYSVHAFTQIGRILPLGTDRQHQTKRRIFTLNGTIPIHKMP
jgi:hypothetical protein